MGRETGAIFKVSRRLGFSVLESGKEFSKGNKNKSDNERGFRGRRRGFGGSAYKKQLLEKQKLRHLYQIGEKQLKNIYKKAEKKPGITSLTILLTLESRLDNVVYRLGFALTRRQSRQLVNHGHILVNDKKVDIPSYTVKSDDVVSVHPKAKEFNIVKEALQQEKVSPEYLSVDKEKMEGKIVRQPVREELNAEINESLIVEYYNRLL